MSLYGALFAGVAGLNAQSNKLGIISDNVANVNTVGYKSGSAVFQTLVTSASNVTAYSPGGVLGSNEQLVSTQGLLQSTSSPTDIAVSGNGFFIVNQKPDQSGQVLFTRAGSFTQDAQGNFVNTAGLFLQAWPLDRNGLLPGAPGNLNTTSSANLASLQTVNVENLTGTASPTTNVSIGANLNASQGAFNGAGKSIVMDATDSANHGIKANDIIIPTGVDSIARGDTLAISTGAGLNYIYNYGGFTFGRDISSGTPGDSGTFLKSAPPSTVNSAVAIAAGGFKTGAAGANTVITVTVASTANLRTGYTVTIAGEAGAVDGVASAAINGPQNITVIDATHFSFVSTGTAGAGNTAGGGAATVTPNPLTLNNSVVALAGGTPLTSGSVATTGSLSSVVVTVPSTAGLRTGDTVTVANMTGGTFLDTTIPAAEVNGTHQITVLDATHYYFSTATAGTAGNTAGGNAAMSSTNDPITTTNLSRVITVSQPTNGLVVGDVVTLSGISAAVDGIPSNELNNSFVVTAIVDANHYQVTMPTTAATSTGGGGTGTIISTVRPFVGDIMDATNASQPFLGVTGTAGFTSAALKFSVTTAASGTVSFTYTTTAPNAQLGQFNNLNNLADAINNVSGLTARVVNNRLYVGASDANAAITFANGSTTGISGPPVQSGINWVGELGLANVGSGLNRFSTMQSLSNLINLSSGLTATVENPLGQADVKVNVQNPLDTITFADGAGNTGSLLAELGLVNSLNSGSATPQTTGALGPAYDPSVAAKNMASGAIPPQFSRPVTVYDGLGTAHNLNVAFLKTSTNTWAVEVFAQPPGDINSALPNGQIASGNLVFNGDGSLRSVSSSLSSPLTLNWTNGSTPTNITYNWGTAGQPFGTPNAAAIGKTDGLSQFDSGYNVNFVNQNGAPVGQLTGISIDSNGFITASYNNGQTSKLYKIPLGNFTDPNNLQSSSGDAYSQTTGSGVVNLKQPGQSGVGTISSGALEASNVELAGQLTDMIVAQRAYQANTKVIQTADTLLNSLDQIIQ